MTFEIVIIKKNKKSKKSLRGKDNEHISGK